MAGPAAPTPLGGPTPAPAAPAAPPRPLSALAVVSLALSIVFPLGSIPAIVTGSMALRRIESRRQSGRLLAQVGRTLGWIGVAAAVILAAIYVPPALFDDDEDRPEVPSQACERDTDAITIAVLAWHADAEDPEPGKEVAPWPISIDELRGVGLLDEESRLHSLEGDGSSPPTIVKLPNACASEHLLQIE